MPPEAGGAIVFAVLLFIRLLDIFTATGFNTEKMAAERPTWRQKPWDNGSSPYAIARPAPKVEPISIFTGKSLTNIPPKEEAEEVLVKFCQPVNHLLPLKIAWLSGERALNPKEYNAAALPLEI